MPAFRRDSGEDSPVCASRAAFSSAPVAAASIAARASSTADCTVDSSRAGAFDTVSKSRERAGPIRSGALRA